MEHRILASHVETFSQNAQVDRLPEHKRFEYFTNYTVMSQVHPEAFSEVANLADVDVDRDGTFGLDAVAVFINKSLIRTTADVDDQIKSRNLDVEVVLIQSKTSKSIDSGDVLKFVEGSKDFLRGLEKYSISGDECLRRPAEILSYVFSSSVARYLSANSPVCRLVFAYGGSHEPSAQQIGLVTSCCIDLKAQVADFSEFSFEFWNADRLIHSFKQVENQFEVELRIQNNLALDTIDGVDQAYIGYLRADEFIKLITAPDGEIRRNVFYDNVRDFQGLDNSVNQEIASALSDPDSADKFVLYNNGVTVVSSFLKNLGAHRFILRNYQIVNGCQTSNVLFTKKDEAAFARALIPIKIVHTSNADVVAKIIRANNRQTPVPNEAFLTLDKWHKDLQEYVLLESRRLGESLFYERRSREFSLLDGAPEKKRVIGLHAMVRAFAAVYLQRPHMVMANNPNSILRENVHVFGGGHKFSPYLASAMLVYKINEHANRSASSADLMRFRYHVAMLIAATMAGSRSLPSADSKLADKFCDQIIDVSLNESRFSKAVGTAFLLAERTEKDFLRERDFSRGNSPVRSSDFTEMLIGQIYPSR
ncbi:AIPR family protein [Pseudoxanthomonas mexicana]|uniref:AIPR family protein n=1 Tax=Pseudoxanthomonas mexicana TaxID=128785 RepID=A0A7G9T8Y9_PSEMX|nr:AIPR family protein [Pseudoxanthomonas mexicana]QNN76564.1 AIPR family protein [Pseudoxanthomonas mexicana]